MIAKPEGRAEESVVRTGAPWKCTASPECSAKSISLKKKLFFTEL